jgi:RHS repeat-associated protein
MHLRSRAVAIGAALVAFAGVQLAPPVALAAPATPAPPAKLTSVPGADAVPKLRLVDPTKELTQPVPAAWPAPGTADITLPAAAATGSAVRWAPGLPIGAAPAGAAPTGTAPARLMVQVLDHATAARAGRDVLLRIGRADGVASTATAVVALRYSGFGQAYGADWAGRLRLVSLPACALSTPAAADCRATPLPTANDRRAGVLTATTAVPAAGALVALASGPDSDNGDFKATELKPSSSWTAGGSAGDFAWQYPLRVPPSLNGPAPKIGFGYSAQAVDGMTSAVNTQPSWLGEGFNWQPGSIERGYRGCTDDGQAGSGDLCWAGDNATLTLNGQSTELVLDPTTGWRPRDEDGARVERLTGATNGDDDGEYWKVTATDGTQYFFGLNRLPGWRAGTDPETNAVFYEPVFGNDDHEPCHASTFAASSCQQAYRWNLDYVVDPHGNSMSLFYQRELNNYARNKVDSAVSTYVRAGHIAEIDYGTRQDAGVDSVFTGTAPARVRFDVTNRCVTDGASCTLSTANAGNWPDVPVDQVCTATSCPNRYAPTFFASTKLAAVTTEVATGSRTWRRVEQWRLTQVFKDPGDGLQKILWLKQLDHCGTDDNTCMPPASFIPTQLSNRVDPAGTPNSIIRFRMRSITTDTGGTISITYSAPECTAGAGLPTAPDSNAKRCFPAYWIPPGATAPKLEYFHKYRVEQVAAGDLVGNTPDQVTSYFYLGAPAWHYGDNPLTIATRRTWDQWRGYQQVRVVSGVSTETRSETDTTYFRGLNGDKTATGTRSVAVPDSDGGSWVDSDWFAGMPREQITLNGPGGAVVSKTKTDPYQFGPTGTQTLNDTTHSAYVVDTASSTTKTALDGGRGWRTTRSTNGFSGDRTGRLTQVDDEGDTATTADDRCTRTTYASNAAGTLLSLPARVETVSVACSATPDRGKDVISDVRTWYDGATSYGTTLSRGDVTRIENLAAPGRYAQLSRSSYDAYGRVLDTFDALDRKSSTSYTGTPVTRTVGTDAKGFTTTSDLDPAWGATIATTDQNARRTDLGYDGLGRLTAVWLPGRDKAAGATPDQKFAYTIRNAGGPTVVASSWLNAAGTGYLSQYTLYDGWLRERQTQAPAVGGGRLINETLYDSRGLAQKSRPAYFNANAPAGALFLPTGEVAVPNQTVTSYDGAGRPTVVATQVDAVEKWRTTTAYGGDHTDLTAPAGGTGTTTWTDGREQITAVWQYHGNAAAGAHDVTTRAYTPAGDLAKVTDAAGNTWTATYDQRRRRIQVDDPNRGRTTSSYDDAGQTTTITDARNITRVYAYDELGRRTAERLTSATGPLLASWTYDTLPGGRGRPTAQTSFDGAGNAYVSAVAGYTARYQPTGNVTTIPAAAGALAGTYSTAITYNADATVATTSEPAKIGTANFGGLPAETLRYGYNDLGLLTTMTGTTSYVTDTQYLQTGQLSSITQTDGSGKSVLQYWTYEHGTGRLVQHQVLADIPTVVAAETNYGYDQAGNITSVADRLAQYNAGQDDTQCLRYDYLGRVSDAWTPASGNCAATPATGTLGGPAPYWSSFALDSTGNRTSTVERGTGGASTSNYTYPTGSGVARPHTLNSVTTTGATSGTSSYGYDAAGNTTSRAVPGRPAQTLGWDADGRLASLTDTAGNATSYTYTADGDRLLATDTAGGTLYLGDVECRATGSAVSCTRPYGYASAGTVGVRTPGGLSWQAVDHQGTPQYSFRAGDLAESQRRTTPFGTERGTSAAWPSSAGFVNGTKDPTGLTHIGAREYDPALGRFASVDPLFTVEDPQSWHGYAYADNTPVTASDPTGMRLEDQYYGPGGKDKDYGDSGGGGYGGGGWSGSCDGHHSASNCGDGGGSHVHVHKPKDIVRHSTYKHGTELVVYYDGTVTINGHRVPDGVQDYEAFAASLDGALEQPGPRHKPWWADPVNRAFPLHIPKPLANKILDTHWMVGVCPFGGSAANAFLGVNGSVCLAADSHGLGWVFTGGGGLSAGEGDFAGAGVVVSDGNIDDQRGWFTYVDGGAGDGEVSVSGSYAWGSGSNGQPVHTSSVLVGPGAGGSVGVGKSYTKVWHIPWLTW